MLLEAVCCVMVSVIQSILCHHDVLAKSALNNCLLATSITVIIEMIGILMSIKLG